MPFLARLQGQRGQETRHEKRQKQRGTDMMVDPPRPLPARKIAETLPAKG